MQVSVQGVPRTGVDCVRRRLGARIEVATLEARQLSEAGQIVNFHGPLSDGEQAPLAQLSQHAVDVNGGEAQGVGDHELAEGAFELGLGGLSDQAQPFGQLHEEVRRALERVAATDADEMLDHHRLIAGGSP